ncbi:MAG TPA: hypothetical protein VGC87_13865 [Pyrinomonadaceae bacterium]|jgi:hypothetical protein
MSDSTVLPNSIENNLPNQLPRRASARLGGRGITLSAPARVSGEGEV